MSRKTILSIAALAGLAAAMVWQRNALAGLRIQNTELLAKKAEVDRLASENLELPARRAAANRASNAAGNELLRLRNEVRQLRAQQPELDRLKAENERLATETRNGAAPAQKFSEMKGFMAKEDWSNAGFGTPESALQTFFWAIREGDLARLAECVSPPARDHFLRLNEPGNEQERDRTLEGFRGLIAGEGIRVAENEPTDDDKATVGLQATAGGAIIKLQLRRYGTEWKVKDF